MLIDLAFLAAAAYGLRLLYALTAAAETIADALYDEEAAE